MANMHVPATPEHVFHQVNENQAGATPIPEKLNALTSSLNAKCRTILKHNDDAGDSIETFTTRTPISTGNSSDFTNSFSNVSKKHSSISSIPSARVPQSSRPSRTFQGT
nr:hypothetical protein TSUD_349510 [Ipomoea trifida]